MLILWMNLANAADGSLGLEDALRRAVQTSEDVAVAEAGLDSANADAAAALGGWLPAVAGSGSYQHTFASEYDDLFSSAGTGTSSPFSNLPFGAADVWRVGLSASQGIYQGGAVLAQRRLAAAGRALAESNLETAKASVVLSTAQAYYDALLAQQLLQIAESTLAQAKHTLADVTLAQEVGRSPEFEVLRASVQAENQAVAVLQQQRAQQLSEASLRRALHLRADAPLDLSTGLGDEAPDSVGGVAAQIAGIEAGPRANVTLAEAGVASARASVALTWSAALPNLSASASYGFVNYPDDFFPEGDWAKNVTAGVSLSVPLFGGGRAKAALDGSKADLRAAEQRLGQASALADLDTDDSARGLQVAEAQYQATAGTTSVAQRAYEIAETRYQEGISTQTELADARLLLEQALANRARAARDLQVARIRSALLPALPVAGAASY